MYTMVSPTSQSENPKSCRGPIERTIVDSRERARSTLLSPFPLTGCDFVEIIRSTGEKERRKEKERKGGRKRERRRERKRKRGERSRDRLSTLGSVHGFAYTLQCPPGNPREKHDPEISPGTPLPYHPSKHPRISQIPPKIQA